MNVAFCAANLCFRPSMMCCCGLALLCGGPSPVPAECVPAVPAAAPLVAPQVGAPQLCECRLLRTAEGYTLSLFYFEEGENLCFRVELLLESLGQLPRVGSVVILNPCRESYVREWVVPQVDFPLVVREVETRTQDADSARLQVSACKDEGVQGAALPLPHRVAVKADDTEGQTVELRFELTLELTAHCECSSTDMTPRAGRKPLESTSEFSGARLLVSRLHWHEAIAFCPE